MRFSKALANWNLAKTRKEERQCYGQVINSISKNDRINEGQWDKVFRAAYRIHLKFPNTKKDEREMEEFFKSLPEYVPLPKKNEVLAVFLSKKK